MYTQQPYGVMTSPVVNGSDLRFDVKHQNREVPEKQKEFLEKLGWVNAGYHPDTNEELFRKPCPNGALDEVRSKWCYELGTGYWHWYEAVAYEFTKFIGIGDDSGKENPNMSGASAASSQQHK